MSIEDKHGDEKNNRKHFDQVLEEKHRRNRHRHDTKEQDDDSL
jgi:hypothetical protein